MEVRVQKRPGHNRNIGKDWEKRKRKKTKG